MDTDFTLETNSRINIPRALLSYHISVKYVKSTVLIKIKSDQFGSIPKPSTTQSLISMMYAWSKYKD
jgi:hypothetical protein